MPCGIVQQGGVHLPLWQMDVAQHRPTDEAGLHVQHVRVLVQLGHGDVGQSDVVELVDRVQGAPDPLTVPQLNNNLLPNQGLEKGAEKHR